MIRIPPNGFIGQGQQTAANQLVGAKLTRPKRRKRRKATAKRAAPRKRAAKRTGRKKKAARLVKGSAAAKRYMAKIRRMRRK